MTRCLRVPKREGESARSALADAGVLDLRHRIGSDGECLLIPVTCDSFGDYEVTEAALEELEREPRDYRDIAEVPKELREMLPSSFDVVGDVAMLKVPDVLWDYRTAIGKAMMRANRNIRVVFHDNGVKGDFRIRDLERIAGEGSSETVHREFGVMLTTDPTKVYFNPRLSSERHRIAGLVKEGDVVIDMFGGVAPFGTVIGKLAKPSVIYSIDLNPEAERFARLNAENNRIGCLVPMTGDSSVLISDLPEADHIIMNLPQTAERFLGSAVDKLKKGGTAHMYKIIGRDAFPDFCGDQITLMKARGHSVGIRYSELKTYSPTMSVYSMDIQKFRVSLSC